MKAFLRLIGLFAAAALTASCATTAPPPGPTAEAPQRARYFVSAANPLAVEAGMNVLRRGGSAVDAAIAVEAMLSLVEPQSSGLGGGAFMTYYNAATGGVRVYDGRETAPAGATADMFLDDGGQPLSFRDAVLSGRATGVPGVVRMLEMAHRDHGRLAWRDLFGDAERAAAQGFIVGQRLGRFANSNAPQASAPDARAYFAEPDGTPVDTGDRLRNPAYAAFLRRLAAQGSDAMYRGATAQAIVDRVAAGPLPGR